MELDPYRRFIEKQIYVTLAFSQPLRVEWQQNRKRLTLFVENVGLEAEERLYE